MCHVAAHDHADAFRHEAFLYAGDDEFVEGAASFIRDSVAAGEPILTVVSGEKIGLLRDELGDATDGRAFFAEMSKVGANPARIIPAWRDFVDEHAAAGARLRGIGEPIFPERSPAALVECQRHESLLNLAFAHTPGFWLLCPYDTDALTESVIEEAYRSHPFVVERGHASASHGYAGLEAVSAPFDVPLSEPPTSPHEQPFDASTIASLRSFVAPHAASAGLSGERISDLELAVHEVAANSVRHGGGRGVLRVWRERDALICEVHDSGRIDQPMIGRERPTPSQVSGRGLWLVNQLCDLVQVRSLPTGSVVRLHMSLP